MSVETPVLVRKSLAQILAFWRPGSHDWTWADEYRDLISEPVTDRIRQRVASEGIGFADDFAPVLLGSDGRVWDGHHRIVLAIEQGVSFLNVEMAATTATDPTPTVPVSRESEENHDG